MLLFIYEIQFRYFTRIEHKGIVGLWHKSTKKCKSDNDPLGCEQNREDIEM